MWNRSLILCGVAVALGVAAATSAAGPQAKQVRLADATMIVEVNATDGDAGLQVFLDGEPWRSMTVTAPGGRRIIDVQTRSRLRGYGLTELFSESSEPPFTELPLRKFKALFPAGRYRFSGRTVTGKRLTGSARLSHRIPNGPRILAPAADAQVDRGALVARWEPGPQPRGVRIAGYRAIVTREDPLRVFSADLTASARAVTVPAEFLQRGVEYKLEVQAIERSGNQTLTEVPFRIR